jgi:hypothetical protein
MLSLISALCLSKAFVPFFLSLGTLLTVNVFKTNCSANRWTTSAVALALAAVVAAVVAVEVTITSRLWPTWLSVTKAWAFITALPAQVLVTFLRPFKTALWLTSTAPKAVCTLLAALGCPAQPRMGSLIIWRPNCTTCNRNLLTAMFCKAILATTRVSPLHIRMATDFMESLDITTLARLAALELMQDH